MSAYLDTAPRTLPELREDIRRSIATEHAHLRRACAIITAWDTLARVDEEIAKYRRTK